MTGLLAQPTQTVTMLYVFLHLVVGGSKNLGGQTEIENHLITKFLLQWLPESGGVISHPAHSVPTPLNCYNLHGPSWRNFMKSVNLQYNTLVRWADGTNDSLTKRLMFQVLFFFHKILQNSLQKLFQFIYLFLYFFYKITKMKIKNFECPKSIRNYEKNIYLEHQMLGQRVVYPIGPANQRIVL